MGLNKKSIDDINVKGKRVLVRCDFNVPLKNGEITDETRIVAALPTIQKLINDGGKVILCSHLGKVKNGPNEGESLAPVAKRLAEKLGKPVNFVADYNVTGEAATAAVNAMNEGDVVLLQNTRFRGAEETKNGEEFSKELADLADVYVCDAFGSSHRAHASVAGVTKFITAKGGENVVGYLMQKEINFLGNAVEDPVRPFVAILGGAKVADKLNVISNLLEKCDTLIIGGGMAYTFLKAQGYEIGKSLVDDTKIDYCKEMMAKAEKLGKKLLLPVDSVTIADFPNPIDAPVEVEVYDVTNMPADREGLSKLKNGAHILMFGEVEYDTYRGDYTIKPKCISTIQMIEKEDNYPEKRVELHLHTNMSALDAVTSASDLIKRAYTFSSKSAIYFSCQSAVLYHYTILRIVSISL